MKPIGRTHHRIDLIRYLVIVFAIIAGGNVKMLIKSDIYKKSCIYY